MIVNINMRWDAFQMLALCPLLSVHVVINRLGVTVFSLIFCIIFSYQLLKRFAG